MTEEEVERMVQRLMQCVKCVRNPKDCDGEDDENGDCIKYKPMGDLS